MAGVGIDTNRVYPTRSSQSMELPAISQGSGGGHMSRMSHDQEYVTKMQTALTLEEVRYSEMRKKIPGMGRIPRTKFYGQDEDWEKAKMDHIAFIRQHFKQHECSRFVPGKKQTAKFIKDLKCYCGEVLLGHSGMSGPTNLSIGDRDLVEAFIIPDELKHVIKVSDGHLPVPKTPLPDVPWNKETAFRTSATGSFGKINFVNVEMMGGKKPAKYVRLSDNDSVDNLIELMDKHWKINEPKKPNLVISVVGGAKNFRLDGRMRETFSTGLIKAAKTTDAWLITSGFNMGVMKAVGMAVSEGQSFTWHNDRMSHVLKCIAFAPWGYVSNRKALESVDGRGSFNADYKTSNVILHGEPVPLNANHTHFIFVDDGYRNRYGGVAAFRAKFENKLQLPKEVGGLGIPVVLVVVEGGSDAIDDAKKSLEQNIPVVVCAGTGRAADILTYAYSHSHGGKQTKLTKLMAKIHKAYGEKWTEKEIKPKTEEILNKVLACIAKKDLMIIFYMNQQADLDIAILTVLLKAKSQEATETQRLDQLQLALTWDRVDIAQEEIFREDVLWKSGSLDNVLFSAILKDQVEFVQLILQQGVVMKEFLTQDRLMELYTEAMSSKRADNLLFQKMLKKFSSYKSEFHLKHVQELVTHLMDKYEQEFEKRGESNIIRCRRPYKELLIFGILTLRHNIAKFAWEMGSEPVTSAIAASRVYGSMSHFIHRNEAQLKSKVTDYKIEFETLAIDVLDECHAKDHEKAMMLVERRSPVWSQMSSLQMAASANDQQYLASVACQNSISITWKRGIVSHWQRVFAGILLPFLIPCTPLIEMNQMGEHQQLTVFQKLTTFYTAPITKFSHNTMMYIVFLVLFTYMLLVDFKINEITPLEGILVAWIFTFMVDDLYTMISFPSPTFYGKMRDWYDLLKWLDLFNFILAFLAFFLHINSSFYGATKILYCINCIIFYIRIMKTYTANSSLGPKLVMIKRMTQELAMFVMVLSVFLLAYGISSQALLYKQRKPSWIILKDVLYYPYWQLFGEIFLEELETDPDCPYKAANSTESDVYCRESHWLVPFLLAGYLMLGNVLLLNLLIAIFSHVFDTIEQNSIVIWKYQMYFLTMEYDNKTALVPPFSLFTHIYLVIKWIFRKTCCKKKTKGVQFTSRHLEYLQVFEKEEMTSYLRNLKAKEKGSLEQKIAKLQKRNDELFQLLEEEILMEQTQASAIEAVSHEAAHEISPYKNGKSNGFVKEEEMQKLAEEQRKKEKKERKKKKKEKKEKKRRKEQEEKEALEKGKIMNNMDKPSEKPLILVPKVIDNFEIPEPAANQPDEQDEDKAFRLKLSQSRRTFLTDSDSDIPTRSPLSRHLSSLNVPPSPGGLRRRKSSMSRVVSSSSDSEEDNFATHSPRMSSNFRFSRESSTEDERSRHRKTPKRYRRQRMMSDTD